MEEPEPDGLTGQNDDRHRNNSIQRKNLKKASDPEQLDGYPDTGDGSPQCHISTGRLRFYVWIGRGMPDGENTYPERNLRAFLFPRGRKPVNQEYRMPSAGRV